MAALLNSRYRVRRPIGAGAQGSVFLADDIRESNAPVALKVVSTGLRAPLIEEFERLAGLAHPNLAQVRQLQEADADSAYIATGSLYFASEYIDGLSLEDEIAGLEGLERARALLDICAQLASALSHLHARGLVHGDIKPANLRARARERGQPLRAVLLDLGLARAPGAGEARGTLAYLSPEGLAGQMDARSDLYSLGATLVELATGERLYPQEQRQDLIAAILAARDPAEISLPTLPPALASLMRSLVSTDPGERPSGAIALLGHVARIRESLDLGDDHTLASPNFSRPEYVGRAAELSQLRQHLRQHILGERPPGALRLIGPPGCGRRRLFEEALLQQQIESAREQLPALQVRQGTVDALCPAGYDRAEDLFAKWAAPSQKACLLLVDDGDPRLHDLAASALPEHMFLIVCLRSTPRDAIELADATAIRLSNLSPAQSAQLCRSLARTAVPNDWAQRVFALSAGLPGRILDFMRAASALDPSCTKSPDGLLVDGQLSGALLRRVAVLPSQTASVLELLAVARRPLALPALAGLLALPRSDVAHGVDELVDAGLITLQTGTLSCLSEEQAELIDEQLSGTKRRALHRRVLDADDGSIRPAQRARHLLVVGPVAEAARVSLEAIEERRTVGRHDQALALCIASARVMHGKQVSVHAALAAELALTTGDYELASKFAKKARRSRDADIHRRGVQALAKSAQHLGDSEFAADLLAGLVRKFPDDAGARASYARTLLAQGAIEDALEQARRALGGQGDSGDEFLATEVAGLATLYSGALGETAQYFQSLESIAQAMPDKRLLGRAQGLQGMLAQKHGRLEEAAELYRQAAANSTESGASHAAAVFQLNRATVAQRSARFAQALDSFAEALRDLRRTGTPFELAAAHCNRGNVLLALGELESAEAESGQAQHLASAASEPRIHFFAHLLAGDIALRKQSAVEARRHFRDALELAEEHALSCRAHAAMRMAEVDALAGVASGTRVLELVAGDSEEQRAEALASQVRVHLSMGRVTAELGEAIDELTEKLLSADDLDLGWRAAVLAARSHYALGDSGRAREATERAQQTFALVLKRCPEAYRQGLRRHPDAQALEAMQRDHSREGDSTQKSPEGRPLRRLLALGRRLNSELRIDPLLDDIIDTAIELSRAERAFLLLRNSEGQLEARVARNIDRRALGGQEQLSRSIAETVALSGQVVMTVDAEQDSRFGASHSVAALQLRSILAVPFQVKSRIVGTLYLDHRFRRNAFDEDAVELVRELADIAAVALENARLASDNQRRQNEIDSLNRRLESRLESTEAELASARARIPAGRPAAGFASIIGESPAMRSLLAMAERAAACELPVVICGASGTGKELLARAIHHNSNRREQAFVALNCGAVPDSLLEAELFGHQKGAFTGADRARLGLFQVADGGTLFLDEIADTSLAMQSKLLRALQDGEIRPLGAEHTVHVDIRVLCASNQGLEDLVQAGRFRQDLYYRLNVLSLSVPPLCERRSDIQAIAMHILSKQEEPPTISPATLRALQAFHWPGNVRELENELTRACALADSSTIEPAHLSPALQQAQAAPVLLEGDSLLLKPQVEELERSLIEVALVRTEGNQSKAAVLLGLSRYGLQKKLHRYGISSPRG